MGVAGSGPLSGSVVIAEEWRVEEDQSSGGETVVRLVEVCGVLEKVSGWRVLAAKESQVVCCGGRQCC